ncbi:MAG: HNH endonuclease [Phycisphaerae bacterium]|nr:HNH endonuclease [Phycisphaerae bacterium]
MATKCKINYLMLKIRGRLIKLDPDIYYKIISTQHELPYKKYNGDITAVRISSAGYPQIIFENRTKAARPGKKRPVKCITLSRFIMNAKEGDIVDHKNRNPLDNRRKNLRIVNVRQNALNKKCKNTSGYIGVCVRRQRGIYYCIAQFNKSNGKRLSFHLPDSPENRIIAAFARDKFVLAAGEEDYAPLNFPCFRNEPFRSYLLEEDLKKYKGK